MTGVQTCALPIYSEEREPRVLEMPAANERRWDAVREYLVENRKLPAVLVDRLHERGLVFADDHQNAVFVRHNLTNNTWVRGDVTGASLRGTWGEDNHYHGLAPGSARDQGWFWIGTGNGPVRRVLLTESPIDAMSLALLDKERRVQLGVTIYLSTDGSGGFPVKGLRAILNNGGLVAAAFDADQAGELMAWRLAQQLPGVRRLTPIQSKDWNERLMHPESLEKVAQQTANQAQMKQLWQWHLAAKILRRPEAYLKRITEVARETIKGTPLSEKATIAMTNDMTQFAHTLKGSRAMQKSACTMDVER